MPTTHRRINITVDDVTYMALDQLSGQRGESMAGVGLSLIQQALEYAEDFHFARIADARLAQKQKHVAHDKAWR